MTEYEWLTCFDHRKLLAHVNGMRSRQERLHAYIGERVSYIGIDPNPLRSNYLVWEPYFPTDECCDLVREIIMSPENSLRLCGKACSRCNGQTDDDDCWECHGIGWTIWPQAEFKDVLEWRDKTVPKIARRIYDECNWSMMPILADALEEAGCCENAILMHLRGKQLCPRCSLPGEEKSGWCEVCDTETREVTYVEDSMCVTCCGTGASLLRMSEVYDFDSHTVDEMPEECIRCDGSGKRPVQHVRGCWALGMAMGVPA